METDGRRFGVITAVKFSIWAELLLRIGTGTCNDSALVLLIWLLAASSRSGRYVPASVVACHVVGSRVVALHADGARVVALRTVDGTRVVALRAIEERASTRSHPRFKSEMSRVISGLRPPPSQMPSTAVRR